MNGGDNKWQIKQIKKKKRKSVSVEKIVRVKIADAVMSVASVNRVFLPLIWESSLGCNIFAIRLSAL